MKIQCLDNKGTIQTTFLCKINQHTILINCPLEQYTIPSSAHDDDEQDEEPTLQDLSSILSSFSEQGKRSADTEYSSLSTSLKNCDNLTVFRVADFSLIDIHSIDLVLISNHKLMLGLPYLTEYMGYKGRIVATEPTVEYAK
jgi:integrator complex subunit 9